MTDEPLPPKQKAEIPKLTLYRKDGACSIAAHMLLKELNLPFQDVPMRAGASGYEPADKNMTREGFLQLNPAGLVPTLVVDGTTIITELSAVLTYISSLAPERGLTGHTPLEAARVLECMSWLSVTLNEYGFAGYWRPSRMVGFQASQEAAEAVQAHGKRTILDGFARIERDITIHEHAVGNHLTVVDMMLHTFWRWGVEGGFDMESYSNFKRLASTVEQVTSVRDTLAAENIPLHFSTS